MSDSNKQSRLVRLFPDWPMFQRLASKMKIKQIYKMALSEKDVFRGESSDVEKKEILKQCNRKWESTTKNINGDIDDIFRTIPFYREGNIDLDKTREDMLFKYFAYGFTPKEYFAFRLDSKKPKETRDFISGRMRMKFRCQMNDILQAHIFNDKAETYDFFKENYRREAIAIEKPEDFEEFSQFVKKHPVFVKKQVYLAQGQGVELVDMSKTGKTEREMFDSLLKCGKHILEEKIIQTLEMAAFNESSVNTVRAITFNTRHGFKVPYCMIRTGRQGAFVDNSGIGGIQAEIDFETGIVVSDAYDEYGGIYTNHPASGTAFRGYKFSEWDHLKELIFSSAAKVPQIKFIGWDLAHTKDGWVIVEGNENCYVIAVQQIRGIGMRPIFEELMADMDLIV